MSGAARRRAPSRDVDQKSKYENSHWNADEKSENMSHDEPQNLEAECRHQARAETCTSLWRPVEPIIASRPLLLSCWK